MADTLQLKRRYSRNDPNGAFPSVTGMPELAYNRMGMFWRPLIDLTDSPVAPTRLQMFRPVSDWLADPEPGRWSWFARIGVAGLRHQVLRHTGLDEYDCRDPRDLPAELRTPEWETLVAAIERFGELDFYTRTLVVFQLAQLSFCHFAVRLAGPVAPNGDPVHDRYLYEIARIRARCPGQAPQALALLTALVAKATDPLIVLASCGQGISHAIRSGDHIELARTYEEAGAALTDLPDDWHMNLVRSRFHRALALLRLAERQFAAMRREVDEAVRFSDELFPGLPEGTNMMVAVENRRIIIESQIKAAARARGDESAAQVRALCAELNRIDPTCLQARLVVGDGLLAIGDYAEAARWYARAGELGTGAGAVGWYRAAQCFAHIGEPGDAVNAMGRCLELDMSAIEPRQYLESVRAARVDPS
jgi:hypothetical protein